MKKILKRILIALVAVLLIGGGYFLLVVKLDNKVMHDKSDYISGWNSGQPMEVPSEFINGERFYIRFPSVAGDTLLAYGDSGGGLSVILPATIDKLHINASVKTGLIKGIMPMKYVLFSDLVNNPLFPAPMPARHMVIRRFLGRVAVPFLLVPPMDEEMQFISSVMKFDLFLGQNFFMDKAWTIDYPNRKIWVNTPLSPNNTGVQRLGFKKNKHGEKIFGHPSMVIVVNGEVIPVLFDTGASIVLSEEGKKAFGTGEKTIGGSFIAASVFDKWRKEHPGWKVYEKADYGQDVIEVPVVNIGGYDVGPVLFARRPDKNWSQGMIHSMDKVVKGAIGGSGLKYLKVVVDYNAELVRFEQV